MISESVVPLPEGTSMPQLIVWSIAIIITIFILGRRQDKSTDKAAGSLLTEMQTMYRGMLDDQEARITSQQKQINSLRENHNKEMRSLKDQLSDIQVVIATDVAGIIDWADQGALPEHWPGISNALRRIVEAAKHSGAHNADHS